MSHCHVLLGHLNMMEPSSFSNSCAFSTLASQKVYKLSILYCKVYLHVEMLKGKEMH